MVSCRVGLIFDVLLDYKEVEYGYGGYQGGYHGGYHDQGYHGNGYDNYASAGGRGGGYDGGRGGFKNWGVVNPI